MSAEHAHHPNYTQIYFILLVLLAISILGPLAEIRWLTLVTAFGIALVKAYLVVKNFMHIDIAKRYVAYLMVTCLVFMLLFFTGTAPDVMKPEGHNWKKPTWLAEAELAPGHGDSHSEGSGH